VQQKKQRMSFKPSWRLLAVFPLHCVWQMCSLQRGILATRLPLQSGIERMFEQHMSDCAESHF
jgi:hypothetical protein